jgi:hypothetical protein
MGSERKEYKLVDFLPEIETPDGIFNLWKGFAVKPKRELEDIPLFHELLDEVICSGNKNGLCICGSDLLIWFSFQKKSLV